MPGKRISAAAFALAVGARRSGSGWIALCPAHDDKTPSLSIHEGRDGSLLAFCHAGCNYRDILAAAPKISASGGGSGGPSREGAACRSSDRDAARTEAALRLWRNARPAAATAVETYLAARRLWLPERADVRFAPLVRHRSGHVGPAMLALIRTKAGDPIGVHRTWLGKDGSAKADVPSPKMMLGRARGGAVRLMEGGETLVVGEGVETTLSVAAALPEARAWAALSASGLAMLDLPDTPGELVVAADGDRAGLRAADALAERAARLGWLAKVLAAPLGQDWNDVIARGEETVR